MTTTRYDTIAITLHWLMALCIIGMLFLGFFMEDISPATLRAQAYHFHKAMGIALLALAVFRLIWRLTHKQPPLPETMKPFEKLAAHAAHWLIYIAMIGIPLSGWVFTSAAAKYRIDFFGLFNVPFLPIPEASHKAIGSFAHEAHELIAYGLIGLLVLHVLAGLKHHFINRDAVLSHMIPFIKRG